MLKDKQKTLQEKKNINKKFVYGGLGIAIISLILFSLVAYTQYLVNASNSNDSSSVHLVIESGQGSNDIATELRDLGLIKNRFVFVAYLSFSKAGNKLQAGEYDVPKNLNMAQMANFLSHGRVAEDKITFPEGWTLAKMGERLEANGVVSKDDFLAATKKNYDYDFLQGKPSNVDLEGFLYPDTYTFKKDITSDEVVQKMLQNFDKKLTPELKAKVTSSGLSLYETITLASVVEREVAKADDRRLVASVFLNRLEIGMALESCATIQYITGENKKQFTYAETRVPSPYNTYTNRGLPPGPIGSPSIDSIRAVLEPQESDYLYFLSADGVTYFSKTFSEHEAKKAKYL